MAYPKKTTLTLLAALIASHTFAQATQSGQSPQSPQSPEALQTSQALTAGTQQLQRLDALEAEIRELKASLAASQATASGKQPHDQAQKGRPKPAYNRNKWEFTSYGSVAYKSEEVFENIQDVDPERRATTDLERVVTELEYHAAPHWKIEAEIEYEHGGTGTAMEYDGFDEFGEFESEVEAGGEIIVEKAEIEYKPSPQAGVKFGHIYVPVGLGTDLHKPGQYFSAQRHWSEAVLIPQVWHETGVNVFGEFANFYYQALLTTGLNSEFFRTGTWVMGGHQTKFEFVNADDLALTLRLDYGSVKKDNGIGISYYVSDTTDNRNNPGKLEAPGTVTIIGIHGAGSFGEAIVRGQYLSGQLDDTDAIATANKTTPGLNAGTLTTIGSKAEAWFVEAGYNISPACQLKKPLYIFIAADHANPLDDIETGTASKRYSRTETSIGVNYLPVTSIVLKAQAGVMTYAQPSLPDTNTFSLSAGYQFSL